MQKNPKETRTTKRAFHPGPVWLAGIFALALTVRLIVLWQLSQNNPGFTIPTVDSKWHYLWAQAVAAGDWIGRGVFYRAPLYPYLLGIWFKLFGDGVWPIRIMQAVMGAGSAVLVGMVGTAALGRRIGIMAGIVWALYGPMIYYETEFLIPVLIIPLNLLAFLLALRAAGEKGHPGRWLAIGLVLGLSAVARPNILLTLPVFWLWAWVRHPAAAEPARARIYGILAVTIGILIPITPVSIRNYVVGHDTVLISYQGGVNLYLGNNPDADGLTMQMPEVALDESIAWHEFVGVTDSIASAEAGRELRPSEISSHWMGRAVDYMLTNPGTTLRRWLQKTYYILNGFEVGDQTDLYQYTDYSSLLGLLVHKAVIYWPFGLIGAFAFVAIPRLWRDRIHTRPLLVFAILYTLTIVPFIATARHRLPLVMVMVIFAAAGFRLVWNAWRERAWKKAGTATAAAVLLLIAFNLNVTEGIMWNPAFNLYQRALLRDQRGEFYEAIELYEEAIRTEPLQLASRKNLLYDLIQVAEYDSAIAVGFEYMRYKPDDAELINNMGMAYRGMGDTAKAMSSWRIAARNNPALPYPLNNLADAHLQKGEIAEAVAYYRQAIAADPRFTPACNSLATLYAKGRNFEEAEKILRKSLKYVPDHGPTWGNLGAMLLEAGHLEDAIYALNRAIELLPTVYGLRVNLAIAYLQSGDVDNATQQLETILKTDPHNPAANRLRHRIDSVQQNYRPGR